MTNSNRKGKAGEREWAKYQRERDIEARRGQQYSGGTDSPDVVSEFAWMHQEVKRVEALSVYKAMEQAIIDGGENKVPIVAHRRNRKPWLVIMLADDFLRMAKQIPPGGSPVDD